MNNVFILCMYMNTTRDKGLMNRGVREMFAGGYTYVRSSRMSEVDVGNHYVCKEVA